jgi:hypothetical protein
MTVQEPATTSSRAVLGSIALMAGIVLLVLRGIQSVHAFSGMPHFWHNHDALWWAVGMTAVAFGVGLLAQASPANQQLSWRPTRPGRRFQKLLFYTRAGCHLCETAREVLEEHRLWLPEIIEVDIDHDPRLVERFETCVPVVSLDGKVRFRGRLPVELLRRLIEGTPPADT